jgi:hypothetical protein
MTLAKLASRKGLQMMYYTCGGSASSSFYYVCSDRRFIMKVSVDLLDLCFTSHHRIYTHDHLSSFGRRTDG